MSIEQVERTDQRASERHDVLLARTDRQSAEFHRISQIIERRQQYLISGLCHRYRQMPDVPRN